jgi:hypothetical protein
MSALLQNPQRGTSYGSEANITFVSDNQLRLEILLGALETLDKSCAHSTGMALTAGIACAITADIGIPYYLYPKYM